jgi:MFS family permease
MAGTSESSPAAGQSGLTYAWGVVLFLHFAYALSFVDRFIISLLVPGIKTSLGLDDLQMGLLLGPAFAICYVLAGLALGVVVDRSSRRLVIAVAIMTWSLATMGCGVARGFPELFAARVIVGIGEAAIAPAALSLIGDYFVARRRPLAVSAFALGVSVGASAAFVLGGQLVRALKASEPWTIPVFGPAEPWRLAFIIVGAPGLVLACLALLLREPPRAGKGERPRLAAVLPFVAGIWRLLATHFIGFGLFSTLSVTLAAWAPSFLMRRYAMSVATVGSAFGSLSLITGLAGAFLGGGAATWLHRRGRRDATFLTVLIGVGAALVPASLAPLMPTPSLSLILFGLAFLAISFASGPSIAAIQDATPGHYRGQISALYYLTVNLLGLTLGPVLAPAISRYVLGGGETLGPALSLTSAIVIIAGGILLILARRQFNMSVPANG